MGNSRVKVEQYFAGAEQTLGDHFDGKEYPLVLKLDRDYTPMDIAEYIYVTGDEKGFAQGVAEMIEDGEIMVGFYGEWVAVVVVINDFRAGMTFLLLLTKLSVRKVSSWYQHNTTPP